MDFWDVVSAIVWTLAIIGLIILIVSIILNNAIIGYIGFTIWGIEIILGAIVFLIDFIVGG